MARHEMMMRLMGGGGQGGGNSQIFTPLGRLFGESRFVIREREMSVEGG